MPLPEPRDGESREEFISRCMGDENAQEEFPEEEQRSGYCYSTWEREKGETVSIYTYEMRILNQAEAEVWIYESIGEGWFGGLSAKQFKDDLKALGDVDHINIHINSPGGDVFDGITIYNLLKQHKAKKIVNIDGLAASIASIIAMAGDEIRMASNAMMMIHRAWGMSVGNSRDMREMADRREKVDSTLITTYAGKTELSIDEIVALMDVETWMTAAEAKEYGFITAITEELKLAAHYDLSQYKFKNIPASLIEEPVPQQTSQRPDLKVFEAAEQRIKAIREKFK